MAISAGFQVILIIIAIIAGIFVGNAIGSAEVFKRKKGEGEVREV